MFSWKSLGLFFSFTIVIIVITSALVKSSLSEKVYQRNIFQKVVLELASLPQYLDPQLHINSIQRYLNPAKDLAVQVKVSPLEQPPSHSTLLAKTNDRNSVLLYSKYDADLKQSTLEIIELNSYQTVMTIIPDLGGIISAVKLTNPEMAADFVDNTPERFRILHPLIDENLDLIFHSQMSPLFKISLCGDLIWINQKDLYHHSLSTDGDGGYWVPSRLFPSELDEKFTGAQPNNFIDDGITNIDRNGNVIFRKSLNKILIENGLQSLIFGSGHAPINPIHLNDIEVAKSSTAYWNAGDLFLSTRDLSKIFIYRPATNEIIRVISGPFVKQHDVDIISDHQITIFNNNAWHTRNGNFIPSTSEVLIYDFQKETFKAVASEALNSVNFQTVTEGLSEMLPDGSLIVEEQNKGRLFLIGNDGRIELVKENTFDGQNHILNWSRLIDDPETVRSLLKFDRKVSCGAVG